MKRSTLKTKDRWYACCAQRWSAESNQLCWFYTERVCLSSQSVHCRIAYKLNRINLAIWCRKVIYNLACRAKPCLYETDMMVVLCWLFAALCVVLCPVLRVVCCVFCIVCCTLSKMSCDARVTGWPTAMPWNKCCCWQLSPQENNQWPFCKGWAYCIGQICGDERQRLQLNH